MSNLLILCICAAAFFQPIFSEENPRTGGGNPPQNGDESPPHDEKGLSSYICDFCLSQKDDAKECEKVYEACYYYYYYYKDEGRSDSSSSSSSSSSDSKSSEYYGKIIGYVCGYCKDDGYKSMFCGKLEKACEWWASRRMRRPPAQDK